MRRLIGLAIAVIVGLLLAGSPGVATAVPAEPGLGIRLVDVPTAEADNPRARSYIVDHVKPGSVIERRVEVSNGTGDRAEVEAYAAAATVTDDGFVGAEGRTGNDLSSWTSVTLDRDDLAPGQVSMAQVAIRVPDDAVRGERYAVVWASVQVPPATPGGVAQVSRVGIRIYLSVGPGGAPKTDFDIASLTAARTQAGIPEIHVTVRNTGERALDLRGSLSLKDGPGGLSAGPFTVPAKTTLAIGGTRDVVIPLDPRLPEGPWSAKVTVASGTDQRSAKATITFPAVANTAAAPVPVAAGLTAGERLALIVGVVVLAVVVGLLLLARRRRRGTT
ncbi:peptidase [Microlunatus antarcticus]|uniref:LPXTG-motif cell wall anchor domain-containing protein n=1 Tax=Microlunatus antarcticus TaxID=53388 RepID=A0A7W5P7M2_9ACTN|nr:peptidase [Microlunatus antarcticus]MBB3327577.1 hypothetical protein [Microlunatus antarcticus]